jgi:alpha-ketoglutarate-dependent dioxygenase FTO
MANAKAKRNKNKKRKAILLEEGIRGKVGPSGGRQTKDVECKIMAVAASSSSSSPIVDVAPTQKSKRRRKRGRGIDDDILLSVGVADDDERRSVPKSSSTSSSSSSSSSLQQLLKKHRGVAARTPPPPAWARGNDDDSDVERRRRRVRGASSAPPPYLSPNDVDIRHYESCLRTSYVGFVVERPPDIPSSLHEHFELSFLGMDDAGLYLHDVVRPGGKRCTRTVVSRTLVGEPGSTYRYLGLRLFSHPWTDVDDDGDAIRRPDVATTTTGGDNDRVLGTTTTTTTTTTTGGGRTLRELGYPPDTVASLLSMGIANSRLVARTANALDVHVSHRVIPRGMVGSAEFNLTLINRMEPDAIGTKREKDYGMGKVSVGWHRDSGLKDYSSIAVYQTLKGTTSNSKSTKSKTKLTTTRGDDTSPSLSWGVALRAMDGGSGGPLPNVPPLLVPLPSGSVYYMLDDFNHNHEHAVISPSGMAGDGATTIRYSSTHRVAREGRGTWQYIRDKSRSIVPKNRILSCSSRKEREAFVSSIREQQNLMTEIEFEWLRQWFVQGRRHASLHPYWHRPMRLLCDAYCILESVTTEILAFLSQKADSTGQLSGVITEDMFDVLIESFMERSALRSTWTERYRDPIYAAIPEEDRPFLCPCLDRRGRCDDERGQLPEDLNLLVTQLRQWRSAFVLSAKNKSGDGQSGDTLGNIMPGSKKLKGQGKLSEVGSLTKKESKHRASNWERLKANIKK